MGLGEGEREAEGARVVPSPGDRTWWSMNREVTLLGRSEEGLSYGGARD